MIRKDLTKFARNVDEQSFLGRMRTILGGIVLVVAAQQVAIASIASESWGVPVKALAGFVAIILAILALYTFYVVGRAFVRDRRTPNVDTVD